MARSKKYYILRRIDQQAKQNIVDSFLCEFDTDTQAKLEKRLNRKLPLVLIEKTENSDNTESYTNMWTIGEGCQSCWTVYTKGRAMFDYTGVVNPLIHENGEVKFFK